MPKNLSPLGSRSECCEYQAIASVVPEEFWARLSRIKCAVVGPDETEYTNEQSIQEASQ